MKFSLTSKRISHLNFCIGAVEHSDEHVQHDHDGNDVVGTVQIVVDHLRQHVRLVEFDAVEVSQSENRIEKHVKRLLEPDFARKRICVGSFKFSV